MDSKEMQVKVLKSIIDDLMKVPVRGEEPKAVSVEIEAGSELGGEGEDSEEGMPDVAAMLSEGEDSESEGCPMCSQPLDACKC